MLSLFGPFDQKGQSTDGNEGSINKAFGQSILKQLQLLCHWAKKSPDEKQGTNFYLKLLLLLMLHEGGADPASELAHSIAGQI